MAVYIYERVNPKKNAPNEVFEIRQSMSEAPLTKHPETGEPIRRVITGGFGVMSKGGAASPAPSPARSCGTGCGCH